MLALPVVLVLPSIAAALGLWTSMGALQQSWAMRALLRVTLFLEELPLPGGVLGTWELPAAVGALTVWTALTPVWEPRVPSPLRIVLGLPEAALACAGLLGAAGLVAVGVAVDRAFFVFGLAALLAARAAPTREADWASWRNLPWRLAVATGSASMLLYGAASLLEGVTWTNPVFRVSAWWTQGFGSSPWTSGGVWLAGAALSVPALVLRRPVRWVAPLVLGAIAVAGSAAFAGAPHLALARALSGLGLLALALAWAPILHPPHAGSAAATLDPRRLARTGVPILLWAGLCAVRGLSVSMWTVPPELPPGVERLADLDCGFSLRADGDDLWFTDRCRNALGHVAADGTLRTWPLQDQGGTQVEELGGPEDGTLFAAIAAWTDEAQLVLLAIEGAEGPRAVAEGWRDAPDTPYIPLPSCWAAAWIRLPGGEVLVGCENTSQAHRLDPAQRAIVGTVELDTRLEAGSFDAGRSQLYGVALWDRPEVRAWRWPAGELAAERVVGPFNWSALHVPDDDSVWVSRFLEGSILRLSPDDLSVRGRVPLSFGVRAVHHDPVHKLVWAAASYTGRLWAVDTEDPAHRRSLALCGQTRDLTTDTRGRLLVSTDCGLFRVDPTKAFAGP